MYVALTDSVDKHVTGYLHMDRGADLAVVLLWENEQVLLKLLEIAEADGRVDVWVVSNVSKGEVLRDLGFKPLDSIEVYARDIPSVP